MSSPAWDKTVDVVVVGSGGGGLAAALTAAVRGARVLVVEKAPGLGGSTIFSGALAWVPANHLMKRAGIPDAKETALAYIQECLGDDYDDADEDRIRAFLAMGPQMIRFIEAHSPLKFTLTPAPDSFAEQPHGLEQGRNIEPLPLNPAILNEWRNLLLDSPFRIGVPITLGEAFAYTMAAAGPVRTLLAKLKLGPRYLWRRMTGKLSLGPALITGLLKGCKQAGVQVMLNTSAEDLIKDEGRVIGIKVTDKGRRMLIKARQGVILATGGFEWNQGMVREYLPGPIEYPVTSPYCTGDGHLMAQKAGGQLVRMDQFMAWSAGFHAGRTRYHGEHLGYLINALLNNPHCIVVNSAGRRFVNEASHNAAQAYWQVDPDTGNRPNIPAWSIFDSQWRGKYAEESMGLNPGQADPPWLIRGNSLDELAEKTGIDSNGLARTVDRFNEYVRQGRDADFHRGEHAYDWHFTAKTKGNPNLGRIARPPYYAVRVYTSTVGTKGGPMTDNHWRVLDEHNTVVPGLFAVGTLAATIIGPITISASSAIGLILTQGYIAGLEATAPMHKI